MDKADAIKEALRRCQSVAEVNATARHFREDVADLDRKGGDDRTQAIQIRNLAAWKRQTLLIEEARA